MRIILIDDDQLVTLSLKTILESTGSVQVLATGTSGAEAIALYQQWKPDVLLLDIQMPNGSGLDAGEQILQQDPNARILFLTTFSDDAYIAKALELGAKGYLLKQDFAGIVPALEAVMQGQHVFGEQVVSCFSKQFKQKSTFDYAKYDITEKEQEIIAQVAKGYSNKEIAAALCFSEGTIRNYLSSILEKLQLRDRTQLAVYYYHHQMDV
jgi:DNA-binding NarL/FixJ family response regulator